nr:MULTISPECIES: hypothetical protein [Lonsdalea]
MIREESHCDVVKTKAN